VRPQVSTEEERTAFLEALEESLRPLMRVVFEYGASYQELADVMRGVYVSELRERLELQGRSTSETRLGLMTGVTRKEVETLLAAREIRAQQRALANRRSEQLGQLITNWHDDSRFSTPYGAPLELSLKPEGGFRTFDQLLNESRIELDRETVIQLLVQAGCVEVHGKRFIRCVSRNLISANADIAQIAYLGRTSAALNSTLVHNLLCDESEVSYFERTLVPGFPMSDMGRFQLQSQLKIEGADFVSELDRWVSGAAPDITDEKSGRHCGVTMFFFEDKKPLGSAPQN
jgi:hypothetical protein